MDIAPGTSVIIEISRTPLKEAAAKTLVRLCRKDPAVMRHHRQQQAKRPSWQEWRRGGKQWHHQMKTRPALSLRPGAKYTIRATVDVLRDLNSVKRWVKVTPA
jgi:hypothetical protein